MLKTRLTELVGIKYPIIQAGMGPFPVTSLCIAAANAGCPCLSVTWGFRTREELVDAGATTFVETPAELARVILG